MTNKGVIVALIHNQPGDEPYLEQTRDRASWWSDITFVTAPSGADGRAHSPEQSWLALEAAMPLSASDYICILTSRMTVFDHQVIRKAVRMHSGKAIGFRKYQMADDTHYIPPARYDYRLIPYKPRADLADDGLPRYAYTLRYTQLPQIRMLDYSRYGQYDGWTQEWTLGGTLNV